MDQLLITWPCDLDLWLWRSCACGSCGSSSSIRVPSLKFIGLAIRKIWRTMYVTINGPGDLDLWTFDLETGMRVAPKVGNLRSEFGHARPSGSLVIRYVCDGRMDGQKQRLLPPSLRAGHNKHNLATLTLDFGGPAPVAHAGRRHSSALLCPRPLMVTHIIRRISERQGLRTSNLVHGWMTTITSAIWPSMSNVKVARSRNQSEPSWPNAVPVSLAAGGGILCRPNPAATLLV